MPRPASRVEKKRLTLEVSAPVRERMEALQDHLGADSLTEVIRRAVAILDTLITERDRGKQLVLRDQRTGREQELLLARDIV